MERKRGIEREMVMNEKVNEVGVWKSEGIVGCISKRGPYCPIV